MTGLTTVSGSNFNRHRDMQAGAGEQVTEHDSRGAAAGDAALACVQDRTQCGRARRVWVRV